MGQTTRRKGNTCGHHRGKQRQETHKGEQIIQNKTGNTIGNTMGEPKEPDMKLKH